MKLFENLDSSEKSLLLKFPAYISLLAANVDGKMDEDEKKEAIKFTHIKTYSCVPALSEFYKEADKVFQKNIKELDQQLPKAKKQREAAINFELEKLQPVLTKLGKSYIRMMKKSMSSYKEHVSKAHNNIFESFIFPIHIDGLTN